MVQRILIGISALFAGVLVTWFVAIAGVGMKASDITNQTWLNSAPLHLSDLKGKVVMVEFSGPSAATTVAMSSPT